MNDANATEFLLTAQELENLKRARMGETTLTPKTLFLRGPLTLRYETLLQELKTTVAAMGVRRPLEPTKSGSLPNRGGSVDTASDYSDHPNRLKALDHGELRKGVESIEPVLKADGSVDVVASAMKMILAHGGQRIPSSRHRR